jgi:hypothetical protein
MRSRTWVGYALAGQSNARGNNAGNLSGERIGVCHVVDREAGGFAHGRDRSPTWWNGSVSTSAPRVGPGVGIVGTGNRVRNRGRGTRLCKYAIGGSPIADWISTHAAVHVAAMSATGWTFDGGLVWAQGEEDAKSATESAAYETRLTSLMAIYRATFPGLKVCIVQLASAFTPLSGTAPYIADVRAAQAAYVAGDPLATMIDMEEWVGTQHDGVHWTAEAQIDCGERARAALEAL